MTNGNKRDLAGGVDLGLPVMQQVRKFGSEMVQRNATACVLIGVNAAGDVSVSTHTPGGIIQVLGLLAFAGNILGQPGKAPRK